MSNTTRQPKFSFDVDMEMDMDVTPKKMKAGN